MGARRQLTEGDRKVIQQRLDQGRRVATIAREIGRTSQTVAAEIRRNLTCDVAPLGGAQAPVTCALADQCSITGLCGKGGCRKPCSTCRTSVCNPEGGCAEYRPRECPELKRSPFCCNGCQKLMMGRCGFEKRVYRADAAQARAEALRRDSRRGIDMSADRLAALHDALADGLALGQSVPVILQAHPELGVSAQTVYRYINGGVFADIARADLKQAVKRRPRKSDKQKYKAHAVPREYLAGRTYDDFRKLPDDDRAAAVQMDTVVGRLGRDAQSILTLMWPVPRFQLYLLMGRHTPECVVAQLDLVESIVGTEAFRRLLGTILTDNGSEFADVPGMERSINGGKRCSVYFCDAYKSQQKGACERNHELLRDILPKGKTDFDALTRPDMALINSHVNSVPRRVLSGMAPIDLMAQPLRPLLDAHSIERIEPADVCQTPLLVPHAMLPGTAPGRKRSPYEG